MISFSKKPLYLVGTGGLARELYDLICNDSDLLKYFRFAGNLEIRPDNGEISLVKYKNDGKNNVLDKRIDNFQPEGYAQFILASGSRKVRKMFIKTLTSTYSTDNFPVVISKHAYISRNAHIDNGTVITPFCVLPGNPIVGKFNLINNRADISHDALVGDNNIINSLSSILGGAKIGGNNLLSTLVQICPKVSIGSECTLGIGQIIRKDLGDGAVVI